MSEAERLRKWLRALDGTLEALAYEWRSCGEQSPKPYGRLGEIFREHAAVRAQRREVERELRQLGRELGGLPARDRTYRRNGHMLHAAPFDYDGMIRLRAALSPVLAGYGARIELSGVMAST